MARILAYFAHPDDETFGIGGTLALYANEGHHIRVVCATDGDSGLNRIDADDTERLNEIRVEELRAACRQLGILEPILLHYRDSGMAGTPENDHPDSLHQADLGEVAGRFRDVLETEQPDIVITFDATGWYGHPDHIKVYEAVRAMYAGLDAGNVPTLYCTCFAADAMRHTVKLMEAAGEDIPESFRDGSRFRIPVSAIPIVVDTTSVADKKIAAFNEHLTQIGPGGASARFPKEILELRTSREFFLPVANHDALPAVLPFERTGGLFGEPPPDPLLPYPEIED